MRSHLLCLKLRHEATMVERVEESFCKRVGEVCLERGKGGLSDWEIQSGDLNCHLPKANHLAPWKGLNDLTTVKRAVICTPAPEGCVQDRTHSSLNKNFAGVWAFGLYTKSILGGLSETVSGWKRQQKPKGREELISLGFRNCIKQNRSL